MSELLDMIKTRRSIRKYKSDMVPKDYCMRQYMYPYIPDQ